MVDTIVEVQSPDYAIIPEATEAWQDPKPETLTDVLMTLTVIIGETQMTLEELERCAAGHVLVFDTLQDTPAKLYLNGQFIGEGEIVVTQNHYAVRITKLLTPTT